MDTIHKATSKRYRCQRCGHITKQTTNHYGQTYSAGRWNACSGCPPHAKYPQFGGGTVWDCIEGEPPTRLRWRIMHMATLVVGDFSNRRKAEDTQSGLIMKAAKTNRESPTLANSQALRYAGHMTIEFYGVPVGRGPR